MNIVVDTLLSGGVKIVQFQKGVKASSDAVFLSSAIDETLIKKRARILDVGVGNGGVSLCLLKRLKNIDVVGIDVQAEVLNLCYQSMKLNEFDNNFIGMSEDILKPSIEFKNMEFDIIITNPPYYKGEVSPDNIKARSHSEMGLSLDEWIEMSLKRLRTKGVFAIIHKAERVDDIIYSLKKNGMGKIEVVFLYSKIKEMANRVIIRAVKGLKSSAIIYPEVIVHSENGEYTDVAREILEKGKGIFEIF